jgi:hypothetical protein
MLIAKGEELVLIKQKIALINGARILLVSVFAGIALLVFFAQKKHKTINKLKHE